RSRGIRHRFARVAEFVPLYRGRSARGRSAHDHAGLRVTRRKGPAQSSYRPAEASDIVEPSRPTCTSRNRSPFSATASSTILVGLPMVLSPNEPSLAPRLRPPNQGG